MPISVEMALVFMLKDTGLPVALTPALFLPRLELEGPFTAMLALLGFWLLLLVPELEGPFTAMLALLGFMLLLPIAPFVLLGVIVLFAVAFCAEAVPFLVELDVALLTTFEVLLVVLTFKFLSTLSFFDVLVLFETELVTLLLAGGFAPLSSLRI
jgi:hypothetical protein